MVKLASMAYVLVASESVGVGRWRLWTLESVDERQHLWSSESVGVGGWTLACRHLVLRTAL